MLKVLSMLLKIYSVENNKLYTESIKLWGFPVRKKELKNRAKKGKSYL